MGMEVADPHQRVIQSGIGFHQMSHSGVHGEEKPGEDCQSNDDHPNPSLLAEVSL